MTLALQIARGSKALLAGALLVSACSGLCGAWLVALINEAMHASSAARSTLALRFAAISVAVVVTRCLSQAQFAIASQRFIAHLRLHISRHVSDLPYQQLERTGWHRMLVVLTEDVATVAQALLLLPELVMQLAVVAGCLGYLAVLSPHVFLLVFSVGCAGAAAYHVVGSRAFSLLRSSRRVEDDLFRQFRALFEGAKELKLNALRRRGFLSDVLGYHIEAIRGQRARGLVIHAAAASVGFFLFFVLIGLILFVVGQRTSVGERVISGYALMLLYLMLPLQFVLGALPLLSRSRVAAEHIDELTRDGAFVGGAGASAMSSAGVLAGRPHGEPFERIRLVGVTQHYGESERCGRFALGPLDLELRPGEVVFVIGGNGSGKTTLAKLLVGLYPAETGQIWLDGTLVDAAGLERYRQRFSAVFSDFFLFDRILGLPELAFDQRARDLLRVLQLDGQVELVGDAFSTTALSQGQRKRLALLVAYLEDRPVYVFDEWASDQDPTYKDVFYRQLLPELRARGKAVVVITHDDHYFSVADRCLRLERGKLVSPEDVAREARASTRAYTAMAEGMPVDS